MDDVVWDTWVDLIEQENFKEVLLSDDIYYRSDQHIVHGARDAILELIQYGVTFRFVSNVPNANGEQIRRQSLNMFQPGVPFTNDSQSLHPATPQRHHMDGDILIDDNFEAIQQWIAQDIQHIGFVWARPWNMHYWRFWRNHTQIHWVWSWNDIKMRIIDMIK